MDERQKLFNILSNNNINTNLFYGDVELRLNSNVLDYQVFNLNVPKLNSQELLNIVHAFNKVLTTKCETWKKMELNLSGSYIDD